MSRQFQPRQDRMLLAKCPRLLSQPQRANQLWGELPANSPCQTPQVTPRTWRTRYLGQAAGMSAGCSAILTMFNISIRIQMASFAF